ncbi:hypothetical protein SAV31267_024300 [Streptomyces avermitilis]|uniref:Polymerase/histidinol phosphatase N-terminal domain-containing protein n=1 Tax=Streptomyces avermitilis TaxID=33903 RepID=A0A4D4MMY1_STRAX|nr:hypothetical protein SAV31267_024300 [Streptomyces avermitilis]
MPGFTHLHTVSGFSPRYGASHPERLAERASERGMDALALTDRDTLAGTVRFAKACAAAGVRPLFGAELMVASAGEREHGGKRRAPVRGGAFIDESTPRVTFLAREGAAGWADLCRIVTASHTGEGQPLLPWPDNHAEGLTVLLGPASDVGRALAAGRPDRAARLLAPWREVYGDALRLEAVWHGRKGTGPGSLRLAARTVGFAAEQRVRPVLSNAVRYADPGMGPVADVLDAARRLVPVDPTKELDSGEAWLKDADAMLGAAERIVEAAGYRRDTAYRLLEQTQATAAECLVDPEDDLGIGTVHFPEPHLVGAGRRTAQRVLTSRAAAGMVRHGYADRRDYWERMHRELDIIAHHGFASYFLTVAQVVDDVRDMGIRVAARGSGAGSLVNHLLGIAHADPVEHGLLMERFLSKRRAVLPDIDIDVESARRIEVYRAIIGRFGTERVATVAMPETYRVRHAIRDVGAALSMDPADIDRIAKSFPHIRARDARAALAELPELRELAGEFRREGGGTGSCGSWSRPSTPCRAESPCTRAGSCSPTPRCSPVRRSCRPAARGCPCRSSTRRTSRTSGCSSSMCSACGCSPRWRTRWPRWSGRRGLPWTWTPYRRATRRRTGSSGPPRRWAASRSSRRGSGTWWGGCNPPPSMTWWSTSPSSGPDRSPPTWCGRSSRRGTGGRRSAVRTRTWRGR